jgi:glycosyltransferase involved in cell wall biosynthesis
MDVSPAASRSKSVHVLTLTPFYPQSDDEANGCFVSEPLPCLENNGITNSVFAVQPIYRGRLQLNGNAPKADSFAYFALPSGFGLPTSGAFLFSRILSATRRLHESRRLDLIHAHAALPCGHAAALLSRELGIPFVVSAHGLDVFSTRQVQGYAGRWCHRVSAMVYRSARRVICISEHVRQEILAGLGDTTRTCVVPNGVDPAKFSPGHHHQDSNPVILSIGNLIPVKGHELLIHAVAALKEKYPTLPCEIIGNGPERMRLQRLASDLKISDRIIFLGRCNRQAVAEHLRRCAVFALPSRYEGLGCVFLEAMATEKPAIGCRGQGIEEIIQHGRNGYLIGPNSLDELASVLAVLLQDAPLRNRIGSSARQTILRGFTLGHQAQRLTQVYRECLT